MVRNGHRSDSDGYKIESKLASGDKAVSVGEERRGNVVVFACL